MTLKDNRTPMFVNRELTSMTSEYKKWLTDLKSRYRRAQVRAAVKVNGEMLNFYWELGRDIFMMSKRAKYGDGLLKNVTIDLQAEFPVIQVYLLVISKLPVDGIKLITNGLQRSTAC